MHSAKSVSNGQNRPANDSEKGQTPEVPLSVRLAAPFVLLTVENTQTILNLQRALADLSRELFRRQQDTMLTTILRGVGSNPLQDRATSQADLTSFAQVGFQAFIRMAAAMRASNDPSCWTAIHGLSAQPRQ